MFLLISLVNKAAVLSITLASRPSGNEGSCGWEAQRAAQLGTLETDADSLCFTSLPTGASSLLPTAMRQLPSKAPLVQPCGLLTCLLLFGVIQRLDGNGKPDFLPQCPSQASMSTSDWGPRFH